MSTFLKNLNKVRKFRILTESGAPVHRVKPSNRRGGTPIQKLQKKLRADARRALRVGREEAATLVASAHLRDHKVVEGVSVFQLAANMGTSVEMIDNFCGKKRVRDDDGDGC